MKKIAFCALSFLIPVAMCAVDADDVRIALIRADEAFCALAAREGVQTAFATYAAPDATFLDTEPGQLQGKAAVKARFAEWPGGTLTWQPKFAEAAASGELGYTWGTWLLERKLPDGQLKQVTGKYVTLWRRQPDGSWKYVLDTGVSDTPAASGPRKKPPLSSPAKP